MMIDEVGDGASTKIWIGADWVEASASKQWVL